MDRNFEYRQYMRQERLEARRRAAMRKRVRTFTAFFTLAIFVISIVFANSVIASAGEGYNKKLDKMYTSIIVERNDTVWDIASEYVEPGYNTMSELVEEIAYINSLDDSYTIKPGSMLMIPYYEES